MSNSNQLPTATKVLDLLTSKLGAATDVATVGAGLRVAFKWDGGDLPGLFASIGADIDVSMQLPALNPRRGEQLVMGEVDGMRFNAKCAASDQQRVVVTLYTETSDAAAYKQRLESVHNMADSLFVQKDGESPNATLISYVVSRLNDPTDENAVSQLAADLAGVLANHLTSKVKMSDEAAAQLSVAMSARR